MGAITLTQEEEARIQAEMQAAAERERQAMIEFETQNRIKDQERTQPGYTGY